MSRHTIYTIEVDIPEVNVKKARKYLAEVERMR